MDARDNSAPNELTPDKARPHLPIELSWRLLTWSAIVAVTVAAAPHRHLSRQIATGVVIAVAAVAMQLTEHPRYARAAITVATLAGFAGCFLSPGGVAEIPIAMSASRLPNAFDPRTCRVWMVLETIAFAATVGLISRSVTGLLAGAAIPLVVQRSMQHRELVIARDRAEALLAEVQAGREAEEQAAVLRERGRIARDMHDVLAHTLAGLSLQLQAVRAIAARERVGPAVLEPLDKAATLARDGLTEAREVVGTLRDPVGLGLDALPALVERHPGVATFVPSGPPRTVAGEAGHAVYRAVQESLTNAARYAPGSPVAVTLDWDADRLRVRVDDSGPAAGRSVVSGQGTGLGLAGMTERITTAGGTLQTGPRPDGGWRVELTVPVVTP